MKLSKIALVVAVVGLASFASAGPCTPVQYTCNTTILIPSPFTGSGVAALDWTAAGAEITSGYALFTDGSGGPQSATPVPAGQYTDPAFNSLPDGTTLPKTAANPVGYTNAGNNFAFVLGAFFDPNPDAINGDFNSVYPNLTNGTATLSSGVNTYFFQHYGFDSGFGLANNYFEIDVPLDGTAANGSDPGTPSGIWRVGFAINVTGIGDFNGFPDGALVQVFLANGGDSTVTDTLNGGDFVALGNVGTCTFGEGNCTASLILTDSEFDPSNTPEPTTLLLVGTGLLGLARRFRR